MCSACCCDSRNKNCYIFCIIFFIIFALIFQIILVAIIDNSINPENITSKVLSETPLFNFEIQPNIVNGKNNITFFEFKGRERKVGNRTETYDKKSFTKIYQNKFLYEGKDRDYFDYKKEYSVTQYDSCPLNYKPCGYLDSSYRILCLPDGEDCPLNGIAISQTEDDSRYTGYESKTVFDSISHDTYYIYYTNAETSSRKIITEFKLSYGRPCALTSEKRWVSVYANEVEKDNYNCKTYVNSNLYNGRYDQVPGSEIDIHSLYKDNGLNEYFTSDAKIELWVRNYNEMDEECFLSFVDDLNDEQAYYDKVTKAVRGLGSASLILSVGLFIYIIMICRCDFKFNLISLAIPIIGVVVNIITLGIINKSRIRYKCQLEGFNEEIDELLDDEYDYNNTTNIVMASFSLAFYILVMIFSLCLKFMKSRTVATMTNTVAVGINPVMGVYPPVYQTPYPYNANMPYQNVMPNSAPYGVRYA